MDALRDALDSVITVLPKVLLFLVILIVGWIVARVLLSLVARLLSRVGFDRALERGGLRRWTGDYKPSLLAAKLVYYGVLLIALQLAFGVFGPNPVSRIINAIVAFLPLVFVALVIIVISAAIASAVKDVITSALGGLSYGRILGTVAQVFILGLGLIAALNQVNVATTVTMPVLIAILATVGGVIVVGVGGGLVQPMRSRWEQWLSRSESEMGVVRAELARRSSPERAATPAGTPQPSYTGQGVGAAVDPTHPRAMPPEMSEQPTATMPRPGPTEMSDEPTATMPRPGATPPPAAPPPGGGQVYHSGSSTDVP